MAKITFYLMALTVILGLFWAAGLLDGSNLSEFINLIKNPTNLHLSDFIATIDSALILVGGVGIAIGLWVAGKPELSVLGGIATFLIGTIALDFGTIYGIVANSIGNVFAILIFSGIIVSFILEVVSWWGGRG